MPFKLRQDMLIKREVGKILNKGLFYTLVKKDDGKPVQHVATLAEAIRARTRKTRIIKTRELKTI